MSAQLQGIGVSSGVAAGPALALAPRPRLPAETERVLDPGVEEAQAKAALEKVASDLDSRVAQADKTAADVLTAQAMMVRDPALLSKIGDEIRAGRSAPHAVHAAFTSFAEALQSAGGYLAERVADLADLAYRTIAYLLDTPIPGLPHPGHPYVLVATDLYPADAATLDPSEVIAIVTESGGPTSHTAILARSAGIPAVVSCSGILSVPLGQMLLVDGSSGSVIAKPAKSTVDKALDDYRRQTTSVAAFHGPGRTSDGYPVALLANIGDVDDALVAAESDVEGVGLFRTEFLYLDRKDAPTIAEQRDVYTRVFSAFADRRVIIRTLDAGADKPLAFISQRDEPNPALGIRGLRTARMQPELLADQLTAIAQAAADSAAEVWVMAPMVTTAAEAGEFADLAHDSGLPQAGVMIEIPAAALRAHHILDVCDFASIGSNDLSQYTVAADRQLGDLADLLNPWQPALLELIRSAAAGGKIAEKPVGICGEAAADPLFALVLVGLGISSLSMAPAAVPAVRAALANHSLDKCQTIAEAALSACTAGEAVVAARNIAGN